MTNFLVFCIIGIVSGAIYAIAATGLVLTYTTTRIFNLAQGAIGMFLAFCYWQLRVAWGVPEPISLILILCVASPLFGITIDRFIMRRLARTTVTHRLVGTLAIFVFLEGAATIIWSAQERAMPPLISDSSFPLFGGLRLTYDQLTTVIVAGLIVLFLWLFLKRTRVGTAMRAVIDDTDLSQLFGINVNRVQAVSWSIGTALAALAAILIAPNISLAIPTLSLLIVAAFAAAIVGRLSSVGWTYVGALAIGVFSALLVHYLPASNQLVTGLGPSMPFIVLFIAVVVLRQERQSLQRAGTIIEQPVPTVRTSLVWSAALIVVAAVLAPHLSSFVSLVVATGLIYAAILLTLVLLTGVAGQVSLCTFSFVGIGAVLVAHFANHMPYFFAALLATLITGIVGALVALPVLRLRGLYLALATLAFAIMCNTLFFQNSHILGKFGTALTVPAPSIFGFSMASRQAFVVGGAILLVVFAFVVQSIRRSRYGRALGAMRDAPGAASALGLNLVRTKLIVFGLSAMMAGLAGCFLGGLQQEAGGSQFSYLVSLSALLILSIQGQTAVPGAVLGGIFYSFLYLLVPQWISSTTVVNAIQPLGIGGAIFVMINHPEGIWLRQQEGVKRFLHNATGRFHNPQGTPQGMQLAGDVAVLDAPSTTATVGR